LLCSCDRLFGSEVVVVVVIVVVAAAEDDLVENRIGQKCALAVQNVFYKILVISKKLSGISS
jgi:hypothetical protein